ncbi:MAG: hypothetical protein HY690_01985 [Chloroflexi bacterium]|nr:hypothetical protein [Chloroflexota bacterium]
MKSCGQVLILFALLLPVFASGAVLALDSGYWMVQKRQMQYAADVAAMVAGQAINESTASTYGTGGSQTIRDAAKTWLGNNVDLSGCADNEDEPTTAQRCATNHPPQSGPHQGDGRFVEVIINVPAQSLFYNLFRGLGFGTFFAEPTIYARAVAGGLQPLTYAILTTGAFSNSACAQDPMCFAGSGGGSTLGGNLCSNGDIGVSGTNTTVSGSVVAGGTADPGLQGASYVGASTNPACPDPPCDFTGYPTWDSANSYTYDLHSDPDGVTIGPGDSYGGNKIGALNIPNNAGSGVSITLRPGGWQSITIQKGTVTLQPGVYYLDGDFNLSGGTLLASGAVTFVVKGSFLVTDGNIGTSSSRVSAVGASYVKCNTLIYLLAPSSGSNKVQLKSSGAVYLRGAIYAPDTDSSVELGGSGGASLDLLGQILAYKFQLSGTGTTITYEYGMSANALKPYLAE